MRESMQGLTFLERVNLGCALRGHIKALGNMLLYDFDDTKRNIGICAELYACVHRIEPHNNEKLKAVRGQHPEIDYNVWLKAGKLREKRQGLSGVKVLEAVKPSKW